jgi:hypothetical protein
MVNVPSGVYASLGDTYTHACQNNQRANGSLDNCTVTPPIFGVDWLSRDFADTRHLKNLVQEGNGCTAQNESPSKPDSTENCSHSNLETMIRHPQSAAVCDQIDGITAVLTRGIRMDESLDYLRNNHDALSSILIFNIALSFHLRGIHWPEQSKRDRDLRKAQTLYELSYQYLPLTNRMMDNQFGSTGDIVIDWLTMASINNRAQLSFYLYKLAESKQLFEQLIQFILSMEPSQYGDAASFVVHQAASFFRNAVLTKLCLDFPASAAAA